MNAHRGVSAEGKWLGVSLCKLSGVVVARIGELYFAIECGHSQAVNESIEMDAQSPRLRKCMYRVAQRGGRQLLTSLGGGSLGYVVVVRRIDAFPRMAKNFDLRRINLFDRELLLEFISDPVFAMLSVKPFRCVLKRSVFRQVAQFRQMSGEGSPRLERSTTNIDGSTRKSGSCE